VNAKLRAAQAWLCEKLPEMPMWVTGGIETEMFSAEEIGHLCELAVDRTCATCKWAEAEGTNLLCDRVRDAGSCAFLATRDDEAALYVAPTFGCLQWEGK
jgi:hypothetical protein